jgi:putative ABC transport system substrate-binding protein
MKRNAGHHDAGLLRRVGADDGAGLHACSGRSTRRKLLIALGAGVLAAPLASFAQQQGKVPRIGFLISETLSGQASRVEALRAGLRDLGYVENKNIAIELRPADGDYDRLPELAAELVRLKVDVLVAFGGKAVLAAKRATTTIPIVVPASGDPIAVGLTSSLARPSGNITGSAMFSLETSAKRMELLRETIPRVTRVAALLNPANGSSGPALQAMRAAAKSLKLELQPFEARSPKEFGSIFSAMAKGHIDAIVVQQDTLFRVHASEIAHLAAKQRLPSVGNKEFAEAGGLIGYGVNDSELYRRGAYFVDRVLKGAKPGDLPIERPTRFELVVNLKTAKALGITIPQSILVRTDRVIE